MFFVAVEGMDAKRQKDVKRFSKYVAVADVNRCWLWTGALKDPSACPNRRYGAFGLDGRVPRAHQAAWILAHGAIPEKMCVLHRCDTPLCVNPDHLFLGTHADNMADMASKNRSNVRPAIAKRVAKQQSQTHCKRGHELSGYNLRLRGNMRGCKICNNALQQEKRLSLRGRQ